MNRNVIFKLLGRPIPSWSHTLMTRFKTGEIFKIYQIYAAHITLDKFSEFRSPTHQLSETKIGEELGRAMSAPALVRPRHHGLWFDPFRHRRRCRECIHSHERRRARLAQLSDCLTRFQYHTTLILGHNRRSIEEVSANRCRVDPMPRFDADLVGWSGTMVGPVHTSMLVEHPVSYTHLTLPTILRV